MYLYVVCASKVFFVGTVPMTITASVLCLCVLCFVFRVLLLLLFKVSALSRAFMRIAPPKRACAAHVVMH